MDTATLLAHRPHWSTGAAPRTDPLSHLTATEAEVYAALCAGTHGVGVRSEQEFVRFDLVTAALTS
jgi:hypothetical protein